MIVQKEKSFLFQPHVIVLLIIIFIVVCLTESKVLSFSFAFLLSLPVISEYYLKYFQDKVSWSFKKYIEISSIDEPFQVFIEIKNNSVLPIYNLKLNIESNSENEIIFFNTENTNLESSMYSVTIDIPPKSHKTINFNLKGKSRGNHQWTNFDVLLTDPFRLQKLRLEFPKEKLPTFPVVPRIFKLNDLRLKSLLQGYKNTNNSLFMDESSINGTKNYENESFRHIHWLATAKENRLLAKKYQKVHGDIYTIFLNLVGKGQFHLRKDMEEVELLVNYLTDRQEILRLENDIDRSQLKKIIAALSMINTNGLFLSNEQFYQQGFSIMNNKSLSLVIGTPPSLKGRNKWLHIKQ
jgi:hypothetical protein